MSILQSALRKGSISSMRGDSIMRLDDGRPPNERELTPEEVEDRLCDIELQSTQDTQQNRARATSVLFSEDVGTFSGMVSSDFFFNANKYIIAVFISLLHRIIFYCKVVPVIIVLLVVGGQAKSSTVILGLSTYDWIIFLLHIMCINAVAAIAENFIFLSMDLAMLSSYDNVYCYRGFQGPLGHITTIGVMVNFFDNVKLPDLGFPWRSLITTLLTILMLYGFKSYHLRKYYLKVLKTRLQPKLELLAKKKNILTILATTVRRSRNHPIPERPETMPRRDTIDTEAPPQSSGLLGNLNYVFREIVKEAYNSPDVYKEVQDDEQEEEVTSFWESLSSKHRTMLLQGEMTIATISGEIVVCNRKGAISLGKQLYNYMSKNGTLPVTSEYVCSAVRESPYVLPKNVDSTVAMTLELFRCKEESHEVIISEQTVISAVKHVYRSMKYAAGSFSDLQELNQSVLVIVDIVFWIIMFLVAQIILQLDATTILAPMLTILFGASFAFANMLSNTLTAVTFVLFVCPYDVGHRIILGYGQGCYAKGNILTVNLFYTTLITMYNEKLVIPNHILFNERIMNLEESKYATFDVQIGFCADGPHAVSRKVIDEFMSRVRNFLLIEKKGEWKEADIYCIGLDVPKNIIQYAIWAAHEGGWGEVSRTLNGRTKLWEYLLELKREMKIEYMQLAEQREIRDVSATNASKGASHLTGFPPTSPNPTTFVRNASSRSGSEDHPVHTTARVLKTANENNLNDV